MCLLSSSSVIDWKALEDLLANSQTYFNLKEIPAESFPAQADDDQFQTALLQL